MAYDEIQVAGAACNKILEVMVRDSTTGMGKTGLAYGSVTYGYWREGAASGASGTCVTMTKGTYADHGWVELDATNLPGVYQFGVPNAALATGVNAVTLALKATGVIDKVIRILLMVSDGRTALALETTAQAAKDSADAAAKPGDSMVASNMPTFPDNFADLAIAADSGEVIAEVSVDTAAIATAIAEAMDQPTAFFVRGTITDAVTGDPIEGAEVYVSASEDMANPRQAVTEADGGYNVFLPNAGTYYVQWLDAGKIASAVTEVEVL